MTRYERRVLSTDGDVYSVPGHIVEVLEAPRGGRNTITALVEIPDEETPTTAADQGAPDGGSKSVFYCHGTKANDEPCSREVDEPGERCFQHPMKDE